MAKVRAGKIEMDRRASKEREDKLGKFIDRWLDDEDVLDSLDPKTKASLITSRLPKPVEVDQDFEKSMLGLASLLETLPDSPNPTTEYARLRGLIRKQRADLKMERARCKAWAKRLKGEDVKWGELIVTAYEQGQRLRNEDKNVCEALGITKSQFDAWIAKDVEKVAGDLHAAAD